MSPDVLPPADRIRSRRAPMCCLLPTVKLLQLPPSPACAPRRANFGAAGVWCCRQQARRKQVRQQARRK